MRKPIKFSAMICKDIKCSNCGQSLKISSQAFEPETIGWQFDDAGTYPQWLNAPMYCTKKCIDTLKVKSAQA